ncbi:MAG TPA: DUF4920 domain-containing protein [Flavobacteriales bacterium]|nr:DUF4920 domain-containing protein [Flavobacteriales bacterium]
MKSLLTLALSAALVVACSTSAPEAQAQTVKSYGAAITADGAMSMDEFAKAIAKSDSLNAKVACEIITSCTKKGCWMHVKMPDGTPMMVKFKDYAFFVPKEGLEGKKAVIQGYATKEVTTVAELRHYAEDAGKSKEEIEKITEPREDLFFLADGVLITY